MATKATHTRIRLETAVAMAAAAAVLGVVAGYVVRGERQSCSGAARGLSALEAGNLESAVNELSDELRDNPSDSSARLSLAKAYVRLGWKRQARQQLELTAKSAKDSLRGAYLSLSALENEDGNSVEAKTYSDSAGRL